MPHPSSRDDFSRFLVHLTRDCSGFNAESNLLSILKTKRLEARNIHCLFNHEITNLGLTDVLQKRFRSICFTETPLPQIQCLITKTPGRRIELKPYGLVFDKKLLLEEGANPAIYINAKGTELRDYLLREFRLQFSRVKSLKHLRKEEKDYYESILQYYALINVISNNYDFAWEREWRLVGSWTFKYSDIVAIIAEDPELFEIECEKYLPPKKLSYVQRLPVISPYWSYEEIVDEMSQKIWHKTTPKSTDTA